MSGNTRERYPHGGRSALDAPTPTAHPAGMDLLTAVRTATARTRTGALADTAEEHACLLLAVPAARHLADRPEWALLLADLLDVEERLYPDPEPVAVTVVPGTHAAARDVIDLVVALADRYDQTAADPAETVQRSLILAGCAARTRQATQRLPSS